MVRTTVTGLDKVLSDLERLAIASASLEPVLEPLISEFHEVQRAQFSTEGFFGMAAWDPLQPSYDSAKVARWGPKPILEASSRLMQSLTELSGDSIVTVTPQMVELGTEVPYATFHQHGTPRMPARPVFTEGMADLLAVRWSEVIALLMTGPPEAMMAADINPGGLHLAPTSGADFDTGSAGAEA